MDDMLENVNFKNKKFSKRLKIADKQKKRGKFL